MRKNRQDENPKIFYIFIKKLSQKAKKLEINSYYI